MKRVAFYTLGCKVNQYETEAIAGYFKNDGYEVVDFEGPAEVYVVNTCTVTNMSDRKSRQVIRKAKKNNENSIVIVTGCYAQTSPNEVAEIEGVDIVVGTNERKNMPTYVSDILNNNIKKNFVSNIMRIRDFEELNVDVFEDKTRAYIKIQDGCTQFCSYCIIPYARGPIRSRRLESIVEEASKLTQKGYKEIVITGIHIASYGRDLIDLNLIDAIKAVHSISGIERIRLGSIEPNTLSREFVLAMKSLPKVCEHFHVSLQSGCDETLKRMNRKYTKDEYRKSIEFLREHIPDCGVTTDIIVGFPDETDEEFEETYEFLEEINFSKMHIFKFSPRKGTPASTMKEQVSSQKKDERSQRLILLSDKNTRAFNEKFIGRSMPVIFEQTNDVDDVIKEGLTPNYIKVVIKDLNVLKGEIRNIKLIEARDEYIVGELE